MPSRLFWWRARLPMVLWLGLLAGIAIWTAARLGVFSLSEVVVWNGGTQWLPSTFASVDHPFHVARAETLRRALLDGELLRWITHHQGGYPAEFYPLGVAWLEVAVWGLSLGALSIPQVHTIVIVLIFLAPGVAYLAMAKQDGWPPRVAALALVLHVVVPGDWWHGGYTELVQWGLITNVSGAVAALVCLAWLTRYVEAGRGGAAVIAALAAAAGVYANPRSLVALMVVGVGVWLAAVIRPDMSRSAALLAAGRVGLVALLAMLLAAPELLSLARFSQLYQFVRYEWYTGPADFLQSAVTSASAPVFLLGLVGVALAVITVSHVAARAAAVTVVLYAVVTVLLIGDPGGVLSQLEPTRLMPFQRLLTIYLAAAAFEMIVRWLAGYARRHATRIADVATALVIAVLLVLRSDPGAGTMPIPGQTDPLAPALYPVERSAVPPQADFQAAIELADTEAEDGTALLVIGSALSWHQRLWAPLWTDRPLFYDNWLWYWHDDHTGPPGYVWSMGHHYPDPNLALDPTYLARHGIGAVVVTGPATGAAASEPWLERVGSGTFGVFLVRDPTTIVTLAGTNAQTVTIAPNAVTASGGSTGGTATVRRNWYPRWQAIVNGEPAPVTRTDGGYFSVPIPAGPVTITLTYVTDGLDWLGRVLAGAGLVALAAVAVRRRDRAESATSTAPANAGQARG